MRTITKGSRNKLRRLYDDFPSHYTERNVTSDQRTEFYRTVIRNTTRSVLRQPLNSSPIVTGRCVSRPGCRHMHVRFWISSKGCPLGALVVDSDSPMPIAPPEPGKIEGLYDKRTLVEASVTAGWLKGDDELLSVATLAFGVGGLFTAHELMRGHADSATRLRDPDLLL